MKKKILAHFLAEKSFVQNFLNVPQRLNSLGKFSKGKSILVNPLTGKNSPIKKHSKQRKLLINLGGIKNFLVKEDTCKYLQLIEKLANDLLALTSFQSIIICSGCYQKQKIIKKNSKSLKQTFLPKKEFIQEVQNSDIYITSPGLTAFYEALYLFKPTIYLPEQHSSQYYNLNQIKSTFLGKFCISIFDVIKRKKISPNDYKGSCQIMSCISNILQSTAYYEKFRDKTIEKIKLIESIDIKVFNQQINQLIISLEKGIEFDKIPNRIIKNEKKYS